MVKKIVEGERKNINIKECIAEFLKKKYCQIRMGVGVNNGQAARKVGFREEGYVAKRN